MKIPISLIMAFTFVALFSGAAWAQQPQSMPKSLTVFQASVQPSAIDKTPQKKTGPQEMATPSLQNPIPSASHSNNGTKAKKTTTRNRDGGVAGGGGGKLEPLFKEIADNITRWIESGNADLIEEFLPDDVSLTDYKTEMLRVLKNYNVTFTDDKVLIGDFEKTCRSFVDDRQVNQIICNNKQFGTDTPENINHIYRVVHHEFAGLACREVGNVLSCLENNRGEISDYRISNKITAFLGAESIIRLPVKSKMYFGETYICSAEIDDDMKNGLPAGACGALEMAPDLSKIEEHDGTLYSKFLWYTPFPNCPELTLAGLYSSKRQLFLILAVQDPVDERSWLHINQLDISSTVINPAESNLI